MLTDGTRRTPLRLAVNMGWLIEDGDGLYWSNSDGWVDKGSADKFTDEEKAMFNLPMGGMWVSVQQAHEQRVDSMRNHPSTCMDEKPNLKSVGGGATER
jgi:hypothetical protein